MKDDTTDYQYGFKPGVSLPVKPQVAGEFIEKLRQRKNDRLTPKDVIDAARSKKSPIHGCFEWNEKKAAAAHLLNQARYLLRAIVVVKIVKQPIPTTRAFVTVKRENDKKATFTHIADAMSHVDLREQVIKKAWNELFDWRRKYHHLSEFSKVVTVIEEVQAQAG